MHACIRLLSPPTWLPFLIPPLLLCPLTDLLPTAASAPGQVGLLKLAPVMAYSALRMQCAPFVAGFDPLLAMTVRNSSSDGETWQGPCFQLRSLLALPGALLCIGEDWATHTQWGSPANGFGKRPAAVCLAGRSTGMLATDIGVAV
ncbi:hypothetical protein B0H10DRAFT_1953203 [Mycena sp. CBHHK59/15]|nr:hypothetical protein B0H10DRAFT_1953203 [Mycena sp. CBHHK59/15]